MDKATGKAFLVDGKEVCSEVTFTPETADGEVKVSFTFDGSVITKDTEIVVFETLYRDETAIAVHADIDDKDQTVTIYPQPEPKNRRQATIQISVLHRLGFCCCRRSDCISHH